MKNFLLYSTLFASLLFVVNCAPNKSASNSNNGIATANGACQAGYYYSNGQCYYGSGSTAANYSMGNGFWADNHTGLTSLQVTNPTLMKQLYKLGMGVCDRGSNNYGQANCDYYIQGQTDIVIQFPTDGAASPSSALVTIFAYPRYNATFNYQASTGPWWATLGNALLGGNYIPDPKYYSGAYRNPLQIQMSASPTNNNAGFQASGYGDAWSGYNQTLVTIEVLSGNVNSSSTLNYNLKIGGTTVATGRMNRCQTLNCGI